MWLAAGLCSCDFKKGLGWVGEAFPSSPSPANLEPVSGSQRQSWRRGRFPAAACQLAPWVPVGAERGCWARGNL